jgi:transposase-like protein
MTDEKLIPWEDMRTPALAIVARGDQIEPVAPRQYKVHSQSHPERVHTVEVARDRWACSCGFFAQTHQACIHVLAVKLRNGFIGPKEDSERVICARCQSGDVIANGKRHNKSGTITRYLCKACGFRFTGKDGFQRRRSEPEKIALAIDLYFRGMSLRQVVEHFQQVYKLKVSPQTVYNWIAHYSKIAAEWMDSQNAKVGEKWHVDETIINVDGNERYLWNIMDADTRMLLATHLSRGRGIPEARTLFKKSKEVTDVRPALVYTDGMGAYPRAVSKEFMRQARKSDHLIGQGTGKHLNPHRIVPSIRAEKSNNRIERLHGTEKSRTKVMRAFDQDHGAAMLMDGWRVHYDMIRTHQAIGKTPAEAAGIPSLGGFKWHELLKLATTRKFTAEPEAAKSPDN